VGFVSLAPHFCCILTSLRFSRRFFIKARNIKRRVSPSSWSGADTCGQTDGQEKLTGAFRDYVTALEKVNLSLFLNITPAGNEAASIYNLNTKWRQEIIFAHSLQVRTGHRCLPSSAGLFARKTPEMLITKICNQSKTIKSLPLYEDGKLKKSSRICEI
jgi:hypothetical protein